MLSFSYFLLNQVASRAVAQMSVSGEETGGRFSKLLWKLKMRAMPRIREEHGPGAGQLLLKDERIHEGTMMSS